jgi:hypothetical protein
MAYRLWFICAISYYQPLLLLLAFISAVNVFNV